MSRQVWKAGRDTDAAVAVRVMGWTLRPCGVYDCPDTGEATVCVFCERPEDSGIRCPGAFDHRVEPCQVTEYGLEPLPRYSTDVAAALSALEHVAGRKHWRWRIETQEGYDSGPTYYVQVFHGSKVWEGDSQYADDAGDAADSLPLAICRAVLAVVSEG